MFRNDLPRARREGLNVQMLGAEIIVFDPATESAHALNGPAAFVWQHADGTRTVDEIACDMTRKFGAPADAQVVRYALDQLSKRHLMDETGVPAAPWQGMTRRQLLKRAVAGAIVLAVVTTIVVPSPAHAQSAACIPNGELCDEVIPCCPGTECAAAIDPICTDHMDK